MSKLFGKVTIRKKLTMTTAVVFFLVLSMFTLVVVFSANTLLLQRERQNVNNTTIGFQIWAGRCWQPAAAMLFRWRLSIVLFIIQSLMPNHHGKLHD